MPYAEPRDAQAPHGVLARYRAFLTLPGTARLLVSSLAGRLPLGMSSLSILLLVRLQTGSFTVAGLAVGAFTLTSAAAAPPLGILADRFGGRPVLVGSAVAQAIALSALVIAAQARAATGVLVGLAALAGALMPPISAYIRVLWPRVARTPATLEVAYQLDATSQEIIWTCGPLLVAALVAAGSPAAAVLATVAITIAGTIWFATAPVAARPRGASVPARPGHAFSAPGFPIVLAATALMGFGIGAVEVGLPALAVQTGSRSAAGVLLALWSVGSMIGGLAYGARVWSTPMTARYPALLLLVAVATAPLILAGSLAVAIPLSAVAGVGYAPMLACEYALVGALAATATATEAFSWSSAALVGGLAGGNAVAGPLAQTGMVSDAFAVGCVASALAALLVFAGRGRLDAAIAARRP